MLAKSILAFTLALIVATGMLITAATGLSLAETPDTGPDAGARSANVTVEYVLSTGGGTGQLVFVGVGGEIDGEINPTLRANPGDVVKITLINDDGMLHDLVIDEFNVTTEQFAGRDEQDSITFTVDRLGEFVYYCSVPGHRQAGMWGKLIVGEPAAQGATGADIVRDPADVPPAVAEREPQTVRVELVAEEVVGQLADGTVMTYFTFNGTVPGPMLRVRVGDTVEVAFRNETSSQFPHSVDFHAATGPGGGAVYSNLHPGQATVFTFKALNPGLFVYHCATPSVAHHIANGMYGMILVEPEGGLPPVDREFYVMQGEIYTEEPFGSTGLLSESYDKLMAERPEYFVFNGAVGALTDEHPLKAKVGETVRLFFGVGGPNFTSSFHVIGGIMDAVYPSGSIEDKPQHGVQTISVNPGSAVIADLTMMVPGHFALVDHALTRVERGLVGTLVVEGPENPEIIRPLPSPSLSSVPSATTAA